jgi:superfamily II RNA helicase
VNKQDSRFRPEEFDAGFPLDSFQREAIEAIDRGHSVLVSAPTGTGKTVVADFIVAKCLAESRRVIYTAPIKALSNQKFRDYTRAFDANRIGLVTGDLVINHNAPACIMTTEILRNMLLQDRDRLTDLSHVIFDEIHFLADPERGTVWEEILIYLPQHVRVLGLSATIPNADDFAQWLSYVRDEKVRVIREKKRAVPLKIYLFNRSTGLVSRSSFEKQARRERGSHSSGRPDRRSRRGRGQGRNRTHHYEVIQSIADTHLPCLYFVFFRRLTETYARSLGERLGRSLLTAEERERAAAILDERGEDWPPELLRDRELYLSGIAFHHAGVNVLLKALVEELYEAHLVKVLYCTSTFALGINMPVKTVIFDGIQKFDGQRMSPLTVQQFMQKAGRAGRRGMDEVGYVVVNQEFDDFERNARCFGRYEQGRYESVNSSFNLSFNSIVNLLSAYQMMEIQDIVNKSYRNFHHRKILDQLNADIDSVRDELAALLGAAALDEEDVLELDPLLTGAHESGLDEAGQLHRREGAIFKRIEERVAGRHEWLGRSPRYARMLELCSQPEALLHMIADELTETPPHRAGRVRRLRRAIKADLQELRGIRDAHSVRLHDGHAPESIAGQATLLRKRLTTLERKHRREERRLYQNLLEKVHFLREIQYIGADNEIRAGGEILRNIHIEEVFVTELVMADIFSGIDDGLLYGLMAAICADFPRRAALRAQIPRPIRDLAKRVMKIRRSYIVTEAERYNGVRTSFSPELLYLASLWEEGHSLMEIMLLIDTTSDISGDLVSALRRAKDLGKQLKDVYRGDATIMEQLGRVIHKVSRDEVEVLD